MKKLLLSAEQKARLLVILNKVFPNKHDISIVDHIASGTHFVVFPDDSGDDWYPWFEFCTLNVLPSLDPDLAVTEPMSEVLINELEEYLKEN